MHDETQGNSNWEEEERKRRKQPQTLMTWDVEQSDGELSDGGRQNEARGEQLGGSGEAARAAQIG